MLALTICSLAGHAAHASEVAHPMAVAVHVAASFHKDTVTQFTCGYGVLITILREEHLKSTDATLAHEDPLASLPM